MHVCALAQVACMPKYALRQCKCSVALLGHLTSHSTEFGSAAYYTVHAPAFSQRHDEPDGALLAPASRRATALNDQPARKMIRLLKCRRQTDNNPSAAAYRAFGSGRHAARGHDARPVAPQCSQLRRIERPCSDTAHNQGRRRCVSTRRCRVVPRLCSPQPHAGPQRKVAGRPASSGR